VNQNFLYLVHELFISAKINWHTNTATKLFLGKILNQYGYIITVSPDSGFTVCLCQSKSPKPVGIIGKLKALIWRLREQESCTRRTAARFSPNIFFYCRRWVATPT
jgi:hypothetical protein